MAANSQIFTGLALTLLPSASLQQASALKAPFLNSGAGLGTLKVKYVSVATSNQSQGGGRHRGLSVRVNLFDGFARVIESYGNAVASFFEDPEDVLEEAVLEMDNDLTQMRQETARVLTSQKRLQDKYTAAQTASEEWYRKAQLALRKGAEDLSRDALERRKYYADNASHFKAQLDQQNSVVENLNINTKLLESKIQEAESKKDILKARAQSAKTATEASDMMGNVKSLLTMSVYNLLSILMPMEWTEAPDDPVVERIKFTRHEISYVDIDGDDDDDLPNSKKEVAVKHVMITSSPIEVEGIFFPSSRDHWFW